MNRKSKDLTNGPILKTLINLAIPIMATSFVQMAYNMTDMIWLGHVGSDAVAAVGSAGFFVWFGNALAFTTKIGSEVSVSQAIGKKDNTLAILQGSASILIAFVIAVIYMCFIQFNASKLLSVFDYENKSVLIESAKYLRIVSIGFIFLFLNPTFTGIYNGAGVSKVPFLYNTVGLIMNIVLDPILIYGLGMFEGLGVAGAAIATIVSQSVVLTLFLGSYLRNRFPIHDFKLVMNPGLDKIRKILQIGLPVSAHSAAFSMISLTIAQYAADWGSKAVAVMSIGAQIESISWMTASGFSTAIGSFTGQNLGAGKFSRITKGYISTLTIASSIGMLATLAFIFFGEYIFKIFIQESDVLELGKLYLFILAFSQIFMCIEIVSAGCFNGLGKTIPPSFIGITFTASRIPLAYLLSGYFMMGLQGLWWAISLTTVIKGTLLALWLSLILKNIECEKCVYRQFFSWMVPYRFRYRKYD